MYPTSRNDGAVLALARKRISDLRARLGARQNHFPSSPVTAGGRRGGWRAHQGIPCPQAGLCRPLDAQQASCWLPNWQPAQDFRSQETVLAGTWSPR